DAAAPFRSRLERPWRLAGRHAPVLALIGKKILGPCLLDDAEIFLEGGAIRVVDLVMLMRQRAVNSMRLLRHDINPSALITAREAGVRPSAGHVIEHRDIFSDAQRVLRRQYDSELSDAEPLGLHRD